MVEHIQGCDYVPHGLILGDHINGNDIICDYYHQLIQDLITLSTTLNERLSQAKTIIHINKRNLKNFFLESDINVLTKILNNIDSTSHVNFIKLIKHIIENNIIYYRNQPTKMIDSLLQNDLLKHYDRKPHKWLNKWMTLDSNKLHSILDSKIYLSFPHQFNDVFDAQYRFNNSTREYIIKNCLHNVNINGNPSLEKIEQIKSKYIDLFQLQLNSTNICCFSLLNPMHTLSNHMWGLYANCGKGIALQYEIKKVIEFLITNSNFIHNQVKSLLDPSRDTHIKPLVELEYCRLLPVQYKDKTHENMLSWIQNFLMLHVNKIDDLKKAEEMYKFLSNKHIEFEYEQEIRLISLEYAQGTLRETHPLNPDHFLNNENALTLYEQTVAPSGKNSHNRSIPFIKPSEIIYGWNFNASNLSESELELYEQLKTNDVIKQTYLHKSIDYLEKPHQFTIIEKN